MVLEFIVCSQAEITGAPETIRLLPLGQVKSQKGNFIVDAESFQLMREEFQRRGNDIPIDYEHQTLKDVQAPAAGWIKDLVLEDGAIAAKVEWTERGREYLETREYRYTSPVVMVRKADGKAITLHSVALTNTPAIDGMFPIINSLDINQPEEGGHTMDLLKQLAALLGLGEDASEEDVLGAIKAAVADSKKLKENEGGEGKQEDQGDKVVANKVICDLLGVEPGSKTEDVAAAILQLKQSGNSSVELAELKRRLDRREAEEVVERALKAGKLTPPLKDWGVQYALTDRPGFDKFLEKTPPVVPMGEMGVEAPLGTNGTATSETTLAVCKMLGVSKEDLEKYGTEA